MNQQSVHAPAAILLALASGVAAQCDWHISGMADFDQRRLGGLPGDGSMYCVPTSTCNVLAYLSNRGYPGVFSGPRSWQSNSNYSYVSGRDAFLGTLMGTTATGGTGGSGWLGGAVGYLFLTTPGKFVVTEEGSSTTPTGLYVNHVLGGLSCMGYGRYTQDAPGLYTRSGGHVITLTGMRNLCSAGLTVFRFRDPADDSANTTQSPFATADVPMQAVSALFRGDTGDPYTPMTLYRFTSYTSNCFLDGSVTIWPIFGLTTGSSNVVDTLRVLRPVQLEGTPLPPAQDFSTPTGGNIRDVVMHPQMRSLFYITGPAGANPTRLFRFDPSTGVSTPLAPTLLTNPTRLATSRQGELYALDGNTIFVVPDAAGTGAPPSTNSQGVDTLTYDDLTDTLVGLDVGRRQLVLWHRNLANGFATLALPVDPCLAGRAWITVSQADGSLWLGSGQCNTLYKLVGGGGSPLTVDDMVPLPPGTVPAGLNVLRNGHVLFSSNGRIVEMEKINGVWVSSPQSDFAGLDAGPFLFMARNRSDFDPSTMNGPGYANLADPEVIPETRDCYANCDDSTGAPMLTINDFICFQARFAAGDPDANCDDSSGIPVLTVNDFICFQSRFAAGCP